MELHLGKFSETALSFLFSVQARDANVTTILTQAVTLAGSNPLFSGDFSRLSQMLQKRWSDFKERVKKRNDFLSLAAGFYSRSQSVSHMFLKFPLLHCVETFYSYAHSLLLSVCLSVCLPVFST